MGRLSRRAEAALACHRNLRARKIASAKKSLGLLIPNTSASFSSHDLQQTRAKGMTSKSRRAATVRVVHLALLCSDLFQTSTAGIEYIQHCIVFPDRRAAYSDFSSRHLALQAVLPTRACHPTSPILSVRRRLTRGDVRP